eukprot:2429424-Pleurochrysis_carterae.AAC.2
MPASSAARLSAVASSQYEMGQNFSRLPSTRHASSSTENRGHSELSKMESAVASGQPKHDLIKMIVHEKMGLEPRKHMTIVSMTSPTARPAANE